MDLSKLPLKEQRRYWKLLNRQVRACVVDGYALFLWHACVVDAHVCVCLFDRLFGFFVFPWEQQVIKEKNAAGQKL